MPGPCEQPDDGVEQRDHGSGLRPAVLRVLRPYDGCCVDADRILFGRDRRVGRQQWVVEAPAAVPVPVARPLALRQQPRRDLWHAVRGPDQRGKLLLVKLGKGCHEGASAVSSGSFCKWVNQSRLSVPLRNLPPRGERRAAKTVVVAWRRRFQHLRRRSVGWLVRV